MDSIYRQRFIESQYINFYPYIGDNYCNSLPKILILGHSHYGPQEWDSDHELTIDTITDHIDKVLETGRAYRWSRCYRNIGAVLAGKGYYHSNDMWLQLAFFNFFQKNVGSTASDKSHITQELIEQSQKAFFEIIDIIHPNVVIVWGDELWYKYMPQESWQWIDEPRYIGKYDQFPATLIWKSVHPARRYNIDEVRGQWLEVLPYVK